MATIVRALAAAMLVVALSCSAKAEPNPLVSVGDWRIKTMAADVKNPSSYCQAQMTQPGSVDMLFDVTSRYEWRLAFSDPAWTLAKGTRFDVAFVIDDGSPIVAQGRAVDSTMVHVPLEADSILFKTFRRGRSLRVTVGGVAYAFGLSGTNAMLPALVKCVADTLKTAPVLVPPRKTPQETRQAAVPPAGAAPASRPAEPAARERTIFDRQNRSTPDRPTSASASQDSRRARDNAVRTEATVLMANVLSQSGIAGFALIPADQAEQYAGDIVWRAGDLIGELLIMPRHSIGDPDVRASILGTAATRCRGTFMSGMLPQDDKQSVRIFSTCQDGGTTFTGYFAVVARPKGGSYVFATYATEMQDAPSPQQKIKDADEGLRRAAYRVVR